MYEVINGTTRRLKNIDGTITKVAYARVPINYNFGCGFRNTKMNNNEYLIENEIPESYNNSKKLNVMCNILKIQPNEAISKTVTVTAASKYNWHNGNSDKIGFLPNLNDETTYTTIYNIFNNLKNKTLKRNLNTLLYNLTHGETPYANIDYQGKGVVNIFATAYESDNPMYPVANDYSGFITFGGNGFPQPYIVFWAFPGGNFNRIGYINSNPPNQNIAIGAAGYTHPTYGIFCNSDGDLLYVYYCTYKGV